MHDQFDVTLEDADLLGEVELTTNLIIAASESDEHLTHRRDRPDPRRASPPPSGPSGQQVANSTGPLVRSESTELPSTGSSSIVTTSPSAATSAQPEPVGEVAALPGAGPAPASARLSAFGPRLVLVLERHRDPDVAVAAPPPSRSR